MKQSSTFSAFAWAMIIGWAGLLLYGLFVFLADYNRLVPGGLVY
ncbi:hypothetical protein WBJ53_26270 [Spirosoma sp. SC4-14]